MKPRLRIRTLSRGDGLLGSRACTGFGPRGAQLTVAQVYYTYPAAGAAAGDEPFAVPAPRSVLQPRPWPVPPGRDLAAEATAADQLWASALRPLPDFAPQWRAPEAAVGLDDLWTLREEGHWPDFWADEVPRLQALGWQVLVMPGFAHFSVPVQRWHLGLQPLAEAGLEPAVVAALPTETGAAGLLPLQGPRGVGQGVGQAGGWRMALGVEVEGEVLDLAPMLAALLRRDSRWLKADELAAMDDAMTVTLRAPGGKRIEAPVGPLKRIVSALLDLLLTLPAEDSAAKAAHRLSAWEAAQVQALQESLADTMPARAGAHTWQLQGDAGLAALVQRLREAGAPPAVLSPAGLAIPMRPYQQHGLAWLQYLRAQGLAGILADDMGLGKTLQVLAHVLAEKEAGRLTAPALVVLPTSLLANWQAEAARHAPGLRVALLHGPGPEARKALLAPQAEAAGTFDLVLTTYALVWRDIDTLAQRDWHLLVIDEAQQAKNAGSRAARALRQLRARHRLCVTGTPLENHLGELWAHFDLLMPGFLGDTRSFTRLWRKPIEVNGETARAELLARRLRPFILRRRKEDVAPELPPLTEVLRRVPLEGAQRTLYETVRIAVDEQVRRVLERQGLARGQIEVLDALLKLRQVCNHPRLLKTPGAAGVPSAKLALLMQMLPALVAEGRQVLVFSQFTEMLALVAEALAALPAAERLPWLQLTGDTPARQRGEVVRAFQAGEAPLLLLSLKAGGVGLNLTAADTVIHLDPWWNPAVQAQATARAHRIGQHRPVFAYQLVAEGSIEERLLALQARKAALAEGVLGQDAAFAPKFGEDDLRGLLAPLR
jgi:superfamily II DNA or RNA helicase